MPAGEQERSEDRARRPRPPASAGHVGAIRCTQHARRATITQAETRVDRPADARRAGAGASAKEPRPAARARDRAGGAGAPGSAELCGAFLRRRCSPSRRECTRALGRRRVASNSEEPCTASVRRCCTRSEGSTAHSRRPRRAASSRKALPVARFGCSEQLAPHHREAGGQMSARMVAVVHARPGVRVWPRAGPSWLTCACGASVPESEQNRLRRAKRWTRTVARDRRARWKPLYARRSNSCKRPGTIP